MADTTIRGTGAATAKPSTRRGMNMDLIPLQDVASRKLNRPARAPRGLGRTGARTDDATASTLSAAVQRLAPALATSQLADFDLRPLGGEHIKNHGVRVLGFVQQDEIKIEKGFA